MMTLLIHLIHIAGTLVILTLLAVPLGRYLQRVFSGEAVALKRVFGPVEQGIYRLLGVDPSEEQSWKQYAIAFVGFSLVLFAFAYAFLRLQGWLPLNPGRFGAAQMPADLAFNVAMSFVSNTNWQPYTPELTVSPFTNMATLTFLQWISGSMSLAVGIAIIRGFTRRSSRHLGNFWVDTVRAALYVYLPLGTLTILAFILAGSPQTFATSREVITVEGDPQTIPLGPIASQAAMKLVATAGGGYFATNSAHPFENPHPLVDWLSVIVALSVPAASLIAFGRMAGNVRQGWAIYWAVMAFFAAGTLGIYSFETLGNPHFARFGVETTNMEGKEVRFGMASNSLFASMATATSTGSVNASHDSFHPLSGAIMLFNMFTGEGIFGGVGAGIGSILVYVVLAVFIAGLMVGRSPEYLGKRIDRFEVTMSIIVQLGLAAAILILGAIACVLPIPTEGPWAFLNTWPGSAYGGQDIAYGMMTNNISLRGAHGFTEMFYGWTSTGANNGSSFSGLNANTPIYNLLMGVSLFVGRFFILVPMLGLAGSLGAKRYTPPSSGTFPTDTITFATLLVAIVIIVGALTFLPALALGPIESHLQLQSLQVR